MLARPGGGEPDAVDHQRHEPLAGHSTHGGEAHLGLDAQQLAQGVDSCGHECLSAVLRQSDVGVGADRITTFEHASADITVNGAVYGFLFPPFFACLLP